MNKYILFAFTVFLIFYAYMMMEPSVQYKSKKIVLVESGKKIENDDVEFVYDNSL